MLYSKHSIQTCSILFICLLCFCANYGQAGQIFSCSPKSKDSVNNEVNIGSEADSAQEYAQGHDQEAVEMQALNSYLTKLELFSLDSRYVVPPLKDAIDAIEALGIDEFSKLDTESTDLDTKFKPLLGNNSRIVLSSLKQIVSASSSCSQESLNFLKLIVERQTFDGQILNEYARGLLAKCWTEDLNLMPERIERKIGKMATSLFELIGKLAKREYNEREREQAPKGRIVINDLEPPRTLKDRLQQLKQVSFDTDKQRRMFARAIFNQFSGEQESLTGSFSDRTGSSKLEEFYNVSLVAPCGELIDKMQSILSKLSSLIRYSPDNSDASIKMKRLKHEEVDYKLEVYRICKQMRSNDSAIWSILSRIKTRVSART